MTAAGSRQLSTPVPPRRGVTLIELLVVLVLLGLLFTVSGLALASLATPRQSAWFRTLEASRARAIRRGIPVLVDGGSDASGGNRSRSGPLGLPAGAVLFLPDGRALGPGVDPLTGAPVGTR